MRFAETNTRRGKGTRACSLLMAVLIMCSMLFVGQVGTIEASAEGVTGRIYFVCPNNYWWGNDTTGSSPSTYLAVWWWGDNQGGKLSYLQTLNEESRVYYLDIPDGQTCAAFHAFRLSNKNYSSSSYPSSYVNIIGSDTLKISTSAQYNCFVINTDTSYYWTNYLGSPEPDSDGTSSGTFPQGVKIYVNFENSSSSAHFTSKTGTTSWLDSTGAVGVYYWNAKGDKTYYQPLTYEMAENYDKVYSFTPKFNATGFLLVKLWHQLPAGCNPFESTQGGETIYQYVTNDVTSNGGNCINVNGTGNKPSTSWTNISLTESDSQNNLTKNTYTSTISGDYASKIASGELVSFNATFYDYMTDNELIYGWRSLNTHTSRRWYHREPYTSFNQYISDLVGTVSSCWSFPLYFGNFYLYGVPYIDSTQAKVNTDMTYAYGDYKGMTGDLLNFSQFANDSTPAETHFGSSYGKSVVSGLVQDELVVTSRALEDQLYVGDTEGSGIVSPYFSDETVAAGYATKVTAQFPMEVGTQSIDASHQIENGATEVTTYTFDSNNATNNIWFSDYTNINKELTLNYGEGTGNGIVDANKDMGGNTANGYGFFPFDDKSDGIGAYTNDEYNQYKDNYAVDYGFGMRVDINFNIPSGGVVPATNNYPVKFEFTGDDDVWVFLDGKLVLDMGGAHSKASGEINFKEEEAKVTSGSVALGLNNGVQTATSSDEAVIDFSGWFDNENPTQEHRLTVFYIERGMIESNLKMSFTMSPLNTSLDVEKEVKTDGVNEALKSTVDSDIDANEDFEFTFTEEGATEEGADVSKYEYTKSDNTVGTLGDDSKESLENGQDMIFTDCFTEGKEITVTEGSNTKYQYTTTNTVTDTIANNPLDSATSSNDNKTATFTFRANDPEDQTRIHVKYINTIQTNDVTLKKVLKEANGDEVLDKGFSFDVQITLPGDSSPTTSNFTYNYTENGEAKSATTTGTTTTKSITVKSGEANTITIPGLPVGTTVVFTEKASTTDYKTTITDGSTGGSTDGLIATVTVPESGTTNVTYTNTKVTKTVTLDLEATKQVGTENNWTNADSSKDNQKFSFELYSCDSTGTVTGTAIKTADNETSGKVKFDSIKTYTKAITTPEYFRISEKDLSGTQASLYEKDETLYFAKVEVGFTGTDKSRLETTITYYKGTADALITAGSIDNLTKLSSASEIVFQNTKLPQNGSVTVKKVKSDGTTPINGADITLVAAENVDGKWVPKTGAESKILTTGSDGQVDGQVKFTDVSAGDYVVYESKAPEGYELNGEYHYVEVEAGQENTVLVDSPIVDQTSTDLPETGGIGVVIFVVVGVVLIVAAILLLKPKKEKTTSAEKSE